jgi:uncharacterized protein YoxC
MESAMDSTTVIWLVITAAIVAVAVVLIRALLEIRKTVIAVRGLVTRIDAELIPAVKELQGVVADVKITADGIASRVDDVKSAMTAVGDTGRNISRINSVIGQVADVVGRSSLWYTGIKAAGCHIKERISKTRG